MVRPIGTHCKGTQFAICTGVGDNSKETSANFRIFKDDNFGKRQASSGGIFRSYAKRKGGMAG